MTALFDVQNKFTIAKVDGSVPKVVYFNKMKIIDLYYTIKRFSNNKQKHKYDFKFCSISLPYGMGVLSNNYEEIMQELEKAVDDMYKFKVIIPNDDDNHDMILWHHTGEELLYRFKQLKENGRAGNTKVTIRDNEFHRSNDFTIDSYIHSFETQNIIPSVPYSKETVLFPDVDSTGMDIHLDFNAVLEELTPAISKGTDQEKRDAKVILAYLAKKLVEQ